MLEDGTIIHEAMKVDESFVYLDYTPLLAQGRQEYWYLSNSEKAFVQGETTKIPDCLKFIRPSYFGLLPEAEFSRPEIIRSKIKLHNI
jgi:hypothetical protein